MEHFSPLSANRVYIGLARVNALAVLQGSKDIALGACTHVILLAQTVDQGDTLFLTDVGFGGQGPARPIPLVDGPAVKGAALPEMHRLVRMDHARSSLLPAPGEQPSGWALQVNTKNDDNCWLTLYHFTLEEYFLDDLQALSFSVDKSDQNTLSQFVILAGVQSASGTKGIELDDNEDLVKITLFGPHVRRKLGENIEVLRNLVTEQDRLLALREVYGLDIEDSAAQYLKPGVALPAAV